MPSRAGKTKKAKATPRRLHNPRTRSQPPGFLRVSLPHAPRICPRARRAGAADAVPRLSPDLASRYGCWPARRSAMQSWLTVAVVQGALAAACHWRPPGQPGGARSSCCSRPRCWRAGAATAAARCSWPCSCSCCCCTGRPSAPRCRTTRPGRRVWDAVASRLPPAAPCADRHRQRPGRPGAGPGARRPDAARAASSWRRCPGWQPPARAGGGSRARFLRGDYERLDFANYDVVFAYLSPAAMAALVAQGGVAEMRPVACLAVTNSPSTSSPTDHLRHRARRSLHMALLSTFRRFTCPWAILTLL
jgi:hypothetical protein